MTNFVWSSDLIRDEFSDCKTLGEVISAIENLTWNQGEVVCEIFVNGEALTESQEIEWNDKSTSEVFELRVQSSRPDELVVSTLTSIETSLPGLVDGIDKLVIGHRNFSPEAAKSLADTLEDLSWMTDAIFICRVQLEKWPKLEDHVTSWRETEQKHSKCLKELIASLETDDNNLVADILEFDMADTLEDWRRLVPQIKEALTEV